MKGVLPSRLCLPPNYGVLFGELLFNLREGQKPSGKVLRQKPRLDAPRQYRLMCF
jgi:hypothetical protein